ncbi:helix-turn-helix domain-containing protein [Streptomyces chrestomyceticus]|uniref:helix-turn-helix domain-containing protein n=1 Tax=Streptomyces chrestomyceticus TaxID=68185 RepID=UPI003401B9E1
MDEHSEPEDRLAAYPEVMTAGEVADVLRVETQTVVKWFGESHLPGFQVGPKRAWRAFKSELRKYIQANRNSWDAASG